MISYRDITSALEDLGLNRSIPVLAHVHTQAISPVKGGLNTLIGALLSTIDNVMMPEFTFSTLVIPSSGPSDRHHLRQWRKTNPLANVFSFDLPSDMEDPERLIFRHFPHTYVHPIGVFFHRAWA